MARDSKSNLANLDINLVAVDVKMQIRTLHAKVTFLQESGAMTEEIERMMTDLTALCNKGNSLPTAGSPAPATTTVLPKLLLKAETMRAHSEYTGPDWKHLLIMPGDIIITCAYINEMTAVGFNTRTNLGGQFPICAAKKVEAQPDVEEAEILLCVCAAGGRYDGPAYLAYESGQYIRVCRREKDKRWAYGFNLSTLNMGRINTVNNFKKVEWHGEI